MSVCGRRAIRSEDCRGPEGEQSELLTDMIGRAASRRDGRPPSWPDWDVMAIVDRMSALHREEGQERMVSPEEFLSHALSRASLDRSDDPQGGRLGLYDAARGVRLLVQESSLMRYSQSDR